MRTAILFLLVSGAVLAAEPRIVNARLETRSASGGLEAEFRRVESAGSGPVWVGYAVPSVDREQRSCCGNGGRTCRCSLEDGQRVVVTGSAAPLEGPARTTVLIRIEAKQAGQVRAFSEDCEIDAAGAHVYWFTDVRPAESVALLARFVPGGGDRVRDGAILAIALHADPAADRAMNQFVDPSQPEPVREKAVFWLGAARGRQGYEVLRRLVENDASDHIRDKAVFALSINKTPEATDAIIRVAREDRSAHVRGQALFWLAQKAGQKAAAAIKNALANDPDTDVKKRAVFSLSQLPKDQGVPLLIETARTNRNAEVRKQAMFWLGQSQDARALAFFEEVLKP